MRFIVVLKWLVLLAGPGRGARLPQQDQEVFLSNTELNFTGKVAIDPATSGLQDIVTWDKHTIFVRGQRVLFYSGEFHPFRLPVTDLYLDVFQKIRALGYNGVSFYIDWALLEGKRGDFQATGIFDLTPFFQAATDAGIYLLARPGPYINAEVSGGGFPGWLQNIQGFLRTSDKTFIEATRNYVTKISEIITANDIVNGGPVILFQPENEYTGSDNAGYFAYVRDQFKAAGIRVPMINNDVWAGGNQAPGTPGGVDIYGHDGYPLGFDCGRPTYWPPKQLDDYMGDWHARHVKQSPDTPYAIIEFQAGSYDPWGGPGFDACETLTGAEFQQVFYKEVFSFGISIFNLYMTYGGTNWGNLGHPGGYTSYDYAAVIRENRLVDREKYSAAKLLAMSLQASPAYWTATPGRATNGVYAGRGVTITPLRDIDGGSETRFFVVRQTDYSSTKRVNYRLTIPSSQGLVSVPQLGGYLSLLGRDSKIHVVDFNLGCEKLLYSSAEVLTWAEYESYCTAVLYGSGNELHELAFETSSVPQVLQGSQVTIIQRAGNWIINYVNEQSDAPRIVRIGRLRLFLVDRYTAYNYWHLQTGDSSVIASAGYLLRNASIEDGTLSLTGDLNATTPLEIIGSPAFDVVKFNGREIDMHEDSETGVRSGTLRFEAPDFTLPSLNAMNWHYLDSLPELAPHYDDSAWTVASKKSTWNTRRKPLLTPKVLFASEYGYHYGSVIYRGTFTSTGAAEVLRLWTQGGSGYAMSAWLGSTFLGSFPGAKYVADHNSTFTLPLSPKGTSKVITVLIDLMGLDENLNAPSEQMKEPRGIIDFDISNVKKSTVEWKLTGNFNGEDYVDKVRGPTNEGALYAERQGFHQPNPPIQSWSSTIGGPLIGLQSPGIGFYVCKFNLDMPNGYDIPLSFMFNRTTTDTCPGDHSIHRTQLWVNGYQFGKYSSNIGPQYDFPVPEGILNYHGENWVAISLWALEEGGARMTSLKLKAGMVIQTALRRVRNSPAPAWTERVGVY